MSDNKTIPTNKSVKEYIDSLSDEQQREDSRALMAILQEASGHEPVLWGDAIIGFGKDRITYASGREIDWMRIGFSPRVGKITIYVTEDADKLTSEFPELGTYKTGKGCIYIRRLSDVNRNELKSLAAYAAKHSYGQQP